MRVSVEGLFSRDMELWDVYTVPRSEPATQDLMRHLRYVVPHRLVEYVSGIDFAKGDETVDNPHRYS